MSKFFKLEEARQIRLVKTLGPVDARGLVPCEELVQADNHWMIVPKKHYIPSAFKYMEKIKEEVYLKNKLKLGQRILKFCGGKKCP